MGDFEKLFQPELVSDGTTELQVYVSDNTGKPLIVVHELPGMTPTFLDYCVRMTNEGFKVYAPLVFRTVGGKMGNFEMIRFCLSKEFRSLYHRRQRKTQPSAFTSWLLHLAEVVSVRHPDRKLGVIGMCLTGGFSLVTFAEKKLEQ